MQMPEYIVLANNMSSIKRLKKLHRKEVRAIREKQKSYGKEKNKEVDVDKETT